MERYNNTWSSITLKESRSSSPSNELIHSKVYTQQSINIASKEEKETSKKGNIKIKELSLLSPRVTIDRINKRKGTRECSYLCWEYTHNNSSSSQSDESKDKSQEDIVSFSVSFRVKMLWNEGDDVKYFKKIKWRDAISFLSFSLMLFIYLLYIIILKYCFILLFSSHPFFKNRKHFLAHFSLSLEVLIGWWGRVR